MMLKSEAFSPFRCDRNIALGINLGSLTKVLPAAEFQRICRDLGALSESVSIECTKEGVKFACSGDIGSGSVILKQDPSLEKESEAVLIEMNEPVSLTFSLKYLTNFCKASGL